MMMDHSTSNLTKVQTQSDWVRYPDSIQDKTRSLISVGFDFFVLLDVLLFASTGLGACISVLALPYVAYASLLHLLCESKSTILQPFQTSRLTFELQDFI